MSKWRLELDIAFNTEREVVAFANLLEELKHKVWVWNDNSPPYPTQTMLRYHECFHDEIPPKQCGNYKYVDFSNPTKIEHLDGTSTKVDPQTLIDEKDTTFTP